MMTSRVQCDMLSKRTWVRRMRARKLP